MPERRILHFDTWDQVLADLDQLERGYTPAGKWSLGQVADHLVDWLSFPIDGFPPQPWFVRGFMALLRATVAPRQLRKVLETGVMPAGSPTMPQTVHPSTDNDRAAVARLRQAIARHRSHPGPWHPSPLFGALDRESGDRLHRIHAGHHLSFLVPNS